MTIKEKLINAKFLADSLQGAYSDDKTTGEYQNAKNISKLIKEVLKIIG